MTRWYCRFHLLNTIFLLPFVVRWSMPRKIVVNMKNVIVNSTRNLIQHQAPRRPLASLRGEFNLTFFILIYIFLRRPMIKGKYFRSIFISARTFSDSLILLLSSGFHKPCHCNDWNYFTFCRLRSCIRISQ